MTVNEIKQMEVGASVVIEGNIAEISIDPKTQQYKTRDQKDQTGNYKEQRLRVQDNTGQYMTCWKLVPPFFDNNNLRQFVKFVGQVQEYRGTKFLSKCAPDGASPAMRPPRPNETAKQPNQAPDWDAIAEGKVRTHLVGAAIQSRQIEINDVRDVNYWLEYCMTGKAPLPPSKNEPDPSIQEVLPEQEYANEPNPRDPAYNQGQAPY